MGRGAWLVLGCLGLAAGSELDVFGDLPGAPPSSASEPRQPEAQPAAKVSINGAWHRRRADGAVEYLELYAGRRFIYRDSRGATVAGEAEVTPAGLVLLATGSQRAFTYELGPDELRLTPDRGDAPQRGHLAGMSPHGAATAVYRRAGWARDEWTYAPASSHDLLGEWRFAARPGTVDALTFLPRGRFVYRGPADISATGAYALADGLLELHSDQVERRLHAALTFGSDGWSLILGRGEEDQPRPLGDLADLPPALRREARYVRPLDDLTAGDLAGHSYELVGAAPEATFRLTFVPGGELRCGLPSGDVTAGTYELDGPRLGLTLPDDAGGQRTRHFLVQPLPDGLLLVKDPAERPPAHGLLSHLPPADQPVARYRTH